MKRKITSLTLKILITLTSLIGVILSLIFYKADSYSHWSKRLLYFTGQSNIWIGITCLVLSILIVLSLVKNKDYTKKWLYVLKFIFTISITITGIVFCTLLAPNARGQYNAWSLSSLLTHVFTPILAIVDFFVDDYKIIFNKKHIALSLIPPLLYFIFASVLCVLKVDFGRGDAFPYFFMNYYSPAGVFGFSDVKPFVIGSFYWIVLLLLLILGLSALYASLHPQTRKYKHEQKLLKKQNINDIKNK